MSTSWQPSLLAGPPEHSTATFRIARRSGGSLSKEDLTSKQAVYVQNRLRMKSKRKSALLAGYSDPDGEADRIESSPAVRKALLDGLDKIAVSMQELWALSREGLAQVLRKEPVSCEKCGTEVWVMKGHARDITNAAGKVGELLTKAGMSDTLHDRARKEDIARDKDELVEAYLSDKHSQETPTVEPNGKDSKSVH